MYQKNRTAEGHVHLQVLARIDDGMAPSEVAATAGRGCRAADVERIGASGGRLDDPTPVPIPERRRVRSERQSGNVACMTTDLLGLVKRIGSRFNSRSKKPSIKTSLTHAEW
jgi:hypothetical protein